MDSPTSPSEKADPNKISGYRRAARAFLHALNAPLGFTITIFGLAAVYFAIVDWRVQVIVRDPEFIAKVARSVRPALIFNADGAIDDMGALDLLESVPEIKVAPAGEKNYDVKIVIRPKKFSFEPIIQSLDISNVSVTAKRAGGLSWEVTFSSRGDFIGVERPEIELMKPRYRLELATR